MGCFWWLRIEIKRPPCCRDFRLVDKDRVHKNISLYVYMHIYELDPNYTWCTTLVEFQRPKYIHKRYRTWTKSNVTVPPPQSTFDVGEILVFYALISLLNDFESTCSTSGFQVILLWLRDYYYYYYFKENIPTISCWHYNFWQCNITCVT